MTGFNHHLEAGQLGPALHGNTPCGDLTVIMHPFSFSTLLNIFADLKYHRSLEWQQERYHGII
jgi:hypothetical protein